LAGRVVSVHAGEGTVPKSEVGTVPDGFALCEATAVSVVWPSVAGESDELVVLGRVASMVGS
jgi:hypothetical protein